MSQVLEVMAAGHTAPLGSVPDPIRKNIVAYSFRLLGIDRATLTELSNAFRNMGITMFEPPTESLALACRSDARLCEIPFYEGRSPLVVQVSDSKFERHLKDAITYLAPEFAHQ